MFIHQENVINFSMGTVLDIDITSFSNEYLWWMYGPYHKFDNYIHIYCDKVTPGSIFRKFD